MVNNSKSIVYRSLFFFILAFYSLILTQFGLENFDTGYIPSFSWRIINGQNIYQDFIYKGPPVSLYFNALMMYFLPESGQFFFIKAVDYVLFAFQVYLVVDALDYIYHFSKIKVEKWALVIVGFMVSLLNFSGYPWPTTDGLWFASAAFWLLSRTSKPYFFRLFLVAFLSILSALTKQSFYLVPLFYLFWINVKFNLKTTLLFVGQLLFLVFIYLTLIFWVTTPENFINQTTGETHLSDLFQTGFKNYIFISASLFGLILLLLFIFLVCYLKAKRQSVVTIIPFFKWMAYVFFTTAFIFCLLKEIELASRIGFLASIFAVIYRLEFNLINLQKTAPVIVLLAIAWSSSISLGYQYPIFLATGIIAGFWVLMGQELQAYARFYFWMALPVCLLAFSYHYKPYREEPIFNLKYSLEKVSPKLKYIKTNKSNFEKYSELKQLIEKYGDNFIVAPNIPMANYLFNHQSKLPADWLIETEVARSQKMFIRLASDKKNYIFLEKSFLQQEQFMPQNRAEFSSISEFIYQHFKCVEQTRYFLIYHSLKANETLP